MSFNWKRSTYLIGIALLLVSIQPALAQETQSADDEEATAVQQFGGPGSVPGQLADDARLKDSLTGATFGKRYADWKEGLKDRHGLDFSVDYNATSIKATNTLNEEDTFSGGVFRFFGQWDLVGRDSGNTGSLIWKVENRHGYTDIPPSGTKNEIGYVGLISPTFSDIGTRLTNLYWRQNLNKGRVEIVAGFLDTPDWVDVYALAPP